MNYSIFVSQYPSTMKDSFQKKRILFSYFSIAVSITLIVFLTGLLSFFFINFQKTTNYFKEQLVFTLYLDNTANDLEVIQLQKSLALMSGIKSVHYISKEEAANNYSKDIGEDFIEFLGYNPLLNAIDIYFDAHLVSPIFLEKKVKELQNKTFIKEITYDKPLLKLLDKNIKRIGYGILILSVVFVFIAIILINNSIGLSIYAKRFTIKTMQLVGATKRFIRKPFLIKYTVIGITSILISFGMLFLFFVKLYEKFPEFKEITQQSNFEIIYLLANIFIVGVIVIRISTYFATQKYLNIHTEKLY